MSAPTELPEALRQSKPPVPLHFLVPGFSKCGTTTLCALLNQHPDLYLPRGKDTKEPRFFTRDKYETLWDWYARFFAGAPQNALLGEGSQSYGGSVAGVIARQRILDLYPDIKLIFIARDPIDRIESSYREFHQASGRFGMVPFDIGKTLVTHPNILADTSYHERIGNFTKFVRPNQVHVVLLEELAAAPDRVLAGCFQFLGVDPERCAPVSHIRLNQGSSKLYDTQRLRWIRRTERNPDTARCLRDLREDLLDPILKKAGLRKRFSGKPMRWRRDLEEYVLGQIGDDIVEFLAMVDRTPSVWPRFAAALARRSEAREVVAVAPPRLEGLRYDDTGINNSVMACDDRIDGTLQVVFRGDDNRVEIGKGASSGEGCVVRVFGDRNRLVLEDGVTLLGNSMVCIDGSDNQVRLSRDSRGEIVVFVETEGCSVDIGRGVSFKSGTPLVISECPTLEWRIVKVPGKETQGKGG